ncbi:MAG: tetratricopeptide repeat protein [Vicinamibacterales bacterium]|nr:tetratricopeptide repeat protein [Vicinamibacterales bacterium]
MKKAIAGILVLAGLALAAILANQAVERDLEYRRLIVQGDEALNQGETFVAIEAFSGAIALKRGSMLAYLKRGEAHRRRGDTPETLAAALRDLRMAAELDSGATRALEALGDVNFKLRRYANAAENYEAYLRLDDHSATVFYKLALAARGDGRLSRAISALQQSVKLNGSFAEAHYVLGLCLKEREQFKDAQSAFEEAIRLSPAMIPAREELVDLHRAQKQTRAEIEQLEALAALDAGKPDRLIAVGLAYLDAGNHDFAVTTLGRAAERSREQPAEQPGVYAALGRVWLQAAEDRGDPTDARKALEALERVATQPSASSEILGMYGRALALAGELSRAEAALRQASQRFPLDPDVLPPLATVAQRQGHLEEARQALIQYAALVDDDRDEAAHAELIGDLSVQMNDPATAVVWYKKSDVLSPADATGLARLADAQLKSGRTQDAQATAARALAKDPTDLSARAVSRRIQSSLSPAQTR